MNAANRAGTENATKRLNPRVRFGIECVIRGLVVLVIPHPGQARAKRALALESAAMNGPAGRMKFDNLKRFNILKFVRHGETGVPLYKKWKSALELRGIEMADDILKPLPSLRRIDEVQHHLIRAFSGPDGARNRAADKIGE